MSEENKESGFAAASKIRAEALAGMKFHCYVITSSIEDHAACWEITEKWYDSRDGAMADFGKMVEERRYDELVLSSVAYLTDGLIVNDDLLFWDRNQ